MRGSALGATLCKDLPGNELTHLLKPARAKRPFKGALEAPGVEENPTRRFAPWSCALQLFPIRYSCALQLFPNVPHEVHEDYRTASQNQGTTKTSSFRD